MRAYVCVCFKRSHLWLLCHNQINKCTNIVRGADALAYQNTHIGFVYMCHTLARFFATRFIRSFVVCSVLSRMIVCTAQAHPAIKLVGPNQCMTRVYCLEFKQNAHSTQANKCWLYGKTKHNISTFDFKINFNTF